jgi:circadian clock protein KaiC
MSESSSEFPPPPARVSSGVVGLDTIVGGGLFKAGIYIVVGDPGAGKTTFGNQACFHHVHNGGRAVYVTLLSETHGRMLGQMQTMTFFDRDAVGTTLLYVNGFTTLEVDGLDGLLRLLRRTVREHRADFLVLDGMVTAGVVARSSIDYKKFINELQTWVGVIGCTVLCLTSASLKASTDPEYTMVDGIFELSTDRLGLRWLRQLCVLKFRGSGYLEGAHLYVITEDGMVVYPRLEGPGRATLVARPTKGQISTGLARLDEIVGGGLAVGSATLLIGSLGAGKTNLGLQFLAAGAAAGEPALHFGFHENPPDTVANGERLGLPLGMFADKGLLHFLWSPATEQLLDALASRIFAAVRDRDIKRLFIDGLNGFRDTAAYPERLPRFLTALIEELRVLGVTSLITDETRERSIATSEGHVMAALFDNILSLRQIEIDAQLHTVISVLKTRNKAHDRSSYRLEINHGGLAIGPKITGTRGPASTERFETSVEQEGEGE